jgi:2-dehydro-3-deoxyphosphogalactonate aldolase
MDLKKYLARCPLIAILRGVQPHEVEAIGHVLEEAGIAIIEVPLNSPVPFASIEILARQFGERLLIGAGTVRNAPDVTRVAKAGGKLIVTPHASIKVVRSALSRKMLVCPGFFTPAEAFAMLDNGAHALKLFPAEGASPAMLRAIKAVLPEGTMILPVGGMDATTIPLWKSAGVAGFGIGSAIYRPGDTAAIVAGKAKALMAALN